MDIKEQILLIWKEQKSEINSISKGRFKGLVKNTKSDLTKIIGVCIMKNGTPVAVDMDVKPDEYETIINNLTSGIVKNEDKANSFQIFTDLFKNNIGYRLFSTYQPSFENKLSQKQIRSPEYAKIVAQIIQKEGQFFNKLFEPLFKKGIIDEEAMRIVCNSYSPTEKSYAYYSIKEDIRKIRHQASQSVPVFANLIADKTSLRQTVDNMQPLLPALNNVLGNNSLGQPIVTKALMKRINGRSLPFEKHDAKAKSIISALSELPPDWFPSNDEEWKSFLLVHTNIGMHIHADNTERTYEKLYKASSGKWSDFANNIVLAWRDIRPPEGATKADMEYIEKALDLKVLSKMSKEFKFNEIKNASYTIAKSIPLPSNIKEDAFVTWIQNMFAPDNSEKTFEAIATSIDNLALSLSKRIVIPCVAYATNLRDVLKTRKVNDKSIDIAKSMIFDGRSLSDGIEILRKMQSQFGSLFMAPIASLRDKNKNNDLDKQVKVNHDELYIPKSNEDIMRKFMAFPGENREWTPLVQAFIAPNNVACVPLINTEMLSYEGEFMNHCVGDYHVSLCKGNKERVFSLRGINEAGEINTLATMALGIHSGKISFSCALGYSNTSSISPATLQPIEMMKEKINELNNLPKSALLRLIGSKSGNEENNHDLDNSIVEENLLAEIQNDCNYNWREKESIIEAMKPFGSFISKPWRKKPEDVIYSACIVEVAKEINPSISLKKPQSLMSPGL